MGAGDHHPIVRLDPVLDVERRKENRLELVIVFLSDWLELVVMALGTLEREPRVRVAIAFAGAILTIAQEMGRDKQIDDGV